MLFFVVFEFVLSLPDTPLITRPVAGVLVSFFSEVFASLTGFFFAGNPAEDFNVFFVAGFILGSSFEIFLLSF